MIVFSDTDVVIKLAALDLLDQALAVLDSEPSEVYVLSLELAKLAAPGIVSDYGKSASDRAVAFARSAKKITSADQQEFLRLRKVIDPGEATLFAATAIMPFDTIITGDRKALAKLSASAECRTTVERVEGKVVCLEQILLDIMSRYGFELVRSRMQMSSMPDIALLRIFHGGGQAAKSDVERKLRERIADIRTSTGTLLSEFFGA